MTNPQTEKQQYQQKPQVRPDTQASDGKEWSSDKPGFKKPGGIDVGKKSADKDTEGDNADSEDHE